MQEVMRRIQRLRPLHPHHYLAIACAGFQGELCCQLGDWGGMARAFESSVAARDVINGSITRLVTHTHIHAYTPYNTCIHAYTHSLTPFLSHNLSLLYTLFLSHTHTLSSSLPQTHTNNASHFPTHCHILTHAQST